MKMHQLPKSKGVKRGKKCLGRGHGSGHGKTSGRGHKGSGARSGYGTRPTFEGGQMPLARKLPKRGFNNKRFAVCCEVVNLTDLEKIDSALTEVTVDLLVDLGLIRSRRSCVKILGEGDLGRALVVKAHRFSASAKEKIISIGGEVVLVDPKGH